MMDSFAHGGDIEGAARRLGLPAAEILDFSASLSPLGPPAWLAEELLAAADRLRHYPDPRCRLLTEAAAARHGVEPAEIVCLNGSTELLHLLPRLARRLGLAQAVACVPAYADYLGPWRAEGLPARALPLDPDRGFAPDWEALSRLAAERPSLIYLGQPNNPTGALLPAEAVRALARRHADCLVLADEAYADFVPGLDRLTRDRPANVLTLLSLTKFYAMPGLRLGLALAEPKLTAAIRDMLPPWSVGVLAQRIGARALADAAYAEESAARTTELRRELTDRLAARPGLTVFPGQANFLLVRLDAPLWPAWTAPRLQEDLLRRERLLIRDCSNFEGLGDRWLRLAVRPRQEQDRLTAALDRLTAEPHGATGQVGAAGTAGQGPAALEATGADAGPIQADAGPVRADAGTDRTDAGTVRAGARGRRTPALMVLGVSSNAGKSLITAGLCRLLARRGARVVPFKAQNMALNSCVTPTGEEIGRAQALQAQACRREMDVRMNPILLKPTSPSGSQVIVLGRPTGVLSAREYFRRKPEFFETVKAAYDALAAENDAVILEGAGSPAEVNLKRHDLVNLRMAAHAGAGAILVGDIDRGGVFASLIGTMACLDEAERSRVAGFVLNKFRGDPTLLGEALDFVTARTGRPFFGVVPWLAGLGLPEEDSVGFRERAKAGRPARPDALDVVCLDLPFISNFTDLDALAAEPAVRVRLTREAAEFGRPDAVLLPGSKNTAADLAWLRERGLDRAVLAHAAAGGVTVGVCGGFQMLGERLDDPLGLESAAGRVAGLGLLPVITEFGPDKVLVRREGLHADWRLPVRGYEIHHGRTRLTPGWAAAGARPDVIRRTGAGEAEAVDPENLLACADRSGRVWGAYLHGLFDADAFRRRFVDDLRARRGLPPLTEPLVAHDVEPGLDRLADALEASLDLPAVLGVMGL